MTGRKDEVNNKALIKSAEGIFKVLQNVEQQVNKTRHLQAAYEGKCTFYDYEVEGDIDALRAIAAACNGPDNSIYAELYKVVPFVCELRNEMDKAKRRKQSPKKVKQERSKAARARKINEKDEERKAAEPLLKFLSGEN